MGIKTVPQPPYRPDLAPYDFWLFPKLRDCHYETIEEMKEAVVKVIDMFTQEDFHEVFQKLLEWYNKCIADRGDYFKGDYSFMCVLSIKVPIRKKSGNLFNDPCIYIYIYIYLCINAYILSDRLFHFIVIQLISVASPMRYFKSKHMHIIYLYMYVCMNVYLSIYISIILSYLMPNPLHTYIVNK